MVANQLKSANQRHTRFGQERRFVDFSKLIGLDRSKVLVWLFLGLLAGSHEFERRFVA